MISGDTLPFQSCRGVYQENSQSTFFTPAAGGGSLWDLMTAADNSRQHSLPIAPMLRCMRRDPEKPSNYAGRVGTMCTVSYIRLRLVDSRALTRIRRDGPRAIFGGPRAASAIGARQARRCDGDRGVVFDSPTLWTRVVARSVTQCRPCRVRGIGPQRQ